jgi:phospholipid transport system substrate-binding protein
MGGSIAALVLLAAATVSLASPREVVQRAVTRVIEVLDASGQAAPHEKSAVAAVIGSARRRAQIRTIADELFDFEEVSRRALSVHWAVRTPAERAEFIQLFTDLLERAYLYKIEAYSGEKIIYPAERIDGDFAVVRSRIIPRKSGADGRARETGLEYRLVRKGGRWKAYDVVIDGVSFVSTYRTQFDRIITASSYGRLVDRMRGAEAKIGPGEGP